MSDSPYQPPAQDEPLLLDSSKELEPNSILPFAQLGLRLLGILLFVDGVTAVFGGLVQGVLYSRAYKDAGYPGTVDPHSLGWAASGIPLLVVGLYLIVGGKWVLLNVFTSTRHH